MAGQSWNHQAFQDYVLGHGRQSGKIRDRAALAKATGIGPDQIGRWFAGKVQPGPPNLRRIAATIPGTDYNDLLILAGHATPEEIGRTTEPTPPPQGHPHAQRINELFGEDSPINEIEQQLLDAMLHRILAPYTKRGDR